MQEEEIAGNSPVAACSRSASSKMMKGQLPPSSRVTFFNPSAQIFATSLPTRVLPVKVTFFTRGCLQRASLRAGVLSRLVVKTLKQPFGKPAFSANVANVRMDRGVSGEGLTTTVQPAAKAAPTLRRIILSEFSQSFT